MHSSSLAHGRRWLLAGFGGLLLLMLAGGADSIVKVHTVNANGRKMRAAYLRRIHLLGQVRSGVYQSSVILRGYLLAPDPQSARDEARKWSDVRSKTDLALETAASMEPGEAPLYQKLRTEMAEYWKLRETLTFSARAGANPLPSNSVVQRRAELLALIDRIDQLNQLLMETADAQLSSSFEGLGLRTLLKTCLSMAVGLGLAAFTVRRTLLLENELQRRYGEGLRAHQELQELSARLVAAQEEERRSISRELHDEVGQSLSALLVEAGNLAARVPPDSLEMRRHVESIKHLAEASVNVIRNMSLLLRPSMLDDLGLVPALEWQAREVSKRTGLRVAVTADENAGELPDAHKTCIYRVVQEALHNCARHAKARSVMVEVRQETSKILLSVEDDGHGFDVRRIRGLGLVGMEERVHHLGGALSVRSHLGKGTTVAVELPLAI